MKSKRPNYDSPEGFTPEADEREPIAVVSMDFARHSAKTKLDSGREPLSVAGMESAVKTGAAGGHAERIKAMAGKGLALEIFGSPNERTNQSSLLRMLGEQFKDAGFESVDPEDIVRWLEEGGQVKKMESPLLNYQIGDGGYKDELMTNFKQSQWLRWNVDRSDQAALEFKQDPEKTDTLSTYAGNVAGFIWALGRLKTKEAAKDRSQEITDLVFASSHLIVLESFLYKVIRQKTGEAKAEEFVNSLNGQGFSENQGFNVKFMAYSSGEEDWEVVVSYEGEEYHLTPKDLVQLMQEGVDLKAKMESARAGD